MSPRADAQLSCHFAIKRPQSKVTMVCQDSVERYGSGNNFLKARRFRQNPALGITPDDVIACVMMLDSITEYNVS